MKITNKELKEVLRFHLMWLNDEEGGAKADLSGANLSGADMRCADLRYADLSGANLSGADLRYADLRYADLSGSNMRCANMSGADMRCANMSGANLRYANLSYANLRGSDLSGANLSDVKYNEYTTFFALQCPEEGAFIGYKKCGQYIVKLQITETAKRSSATSRKCRASEVLVLAIQNLDGSESGLMEYLHNDNYTSDGTLYKVGKVTKPDSFDDNRWDECSNGIHFFITRQEAVNY